MEKKLKGFEEFSDRGRFTSREAYLEKNPDAILHNQCTDVIQYVDGCIIQSLDSGFFMVDDKYGSRSLDEAEVQLFRKYISK
jgi:hypothetical protein